MRYRWTGFVIPIGGLGAPSQAGERGPRKRKHSRPSASRFPIGLSKAVREQPWDETLLAHASTCPVCQEVMQTAQWMRALARDEGTNSALPEPGIVLRRARWQEILAVKQAKMEKERRAVQWAELIPLLSVGLGVAIWGIWNAQTVESALVWVLAWLSPQTWVTAYYAAISSTVALWTAIGAGSLAGLLITSRILGDE